MEPLPGRGQGLLVDPRLGGFAYRLYRDERPSPPTRTRDVRVGLSSICPLEGLVGFQWLAGGTLAPQLPIGLEPDQAPATRLTAWRPSVFAGEHHDHDPPRDGRIARVRRVIDEITVVVIDLEQDLDAVYG